MSTVRVTEKKMATHSGYTGKSHGQRSCPLAKVRGVVKELDLT